MESLEESNCYSLSDSFSLYERYMRSFKVANPLPEPKSSFGTGEHSNNSQRSSSRGNIELSVARTNVTSKHCETAEPESSTRNIDSTDNIAVKIFGLDLEICTKVNSESDSLPALSLENSSATVEHSLLQDKSSGTDAHGSSENSRTETFKQPVFITSTMENSNNAVDSVPLFRDVRLPENVFKLPISELSFNGTIKHVQKLKPIVDPMSALSSNTGLNLYDRNSGSCHSSSDQEAKQDSKSFIDEKSTCELSRTYKTESTGDSQYEELTCKKDAEPANDSSSTKWNLDQSYSSLDASFDSGVRSPDMFSDHDDDDEGKKLISESEPFWNFLKDYEIYDNMRVKKIEEKLQGLIPPPSVTTLKTDVAEMLKKYYCFLPIFNEGTKVNSPEVDCTTPTKRVSFVEIPEQTVKSHPLEEQSIGGMFNSINAAKILKDQNRSNETTTNDKTINIKMCSESEAKDTVWPNVMKCKYYDVYYNRTKYSEKYELLALKYGERYVGAETDTSVNIYSGGFQSPSSATKRKAMRLKMAQAKSPGRRLSHLARRRQAFCSAATINEKAQASTAKMVLIDKNFFPHRKLVNSAERKSPRLRRTPGKKTPTRRTPTKKTPAKTPKTRSGGSSKKKAMRRLLLESDAVTRSQPSRETLKRALFISPENRKAVPLVPSTSVPLQAMRSKRALFGSPERYAESKSCDGSQSDMFLKRKLSALDEEPASSRSKIAKSLSFGGDSIENLQSIGFSRRSSEVFTSRNSAELNEMHKKKLLWAVSEALRVHGWRMSSPGFKEKASSLARLTRRLLALPQHAAKLAAPKLSTSDTMLKLARQYVYAIIQGRTVEDCFEEEQTKLTNQANNKLTGYISAVAYQQMRARQQAGALTSRIKENTCSDASFRQDQPKSCSKNVLQDKLVNVDANSNSSGTSLFDKSGIPLYKSNSMPSFEEAAKMRARRQISFDNVDFPKR